MFRKLLIAAGAVGAMAVFSQAAEAKVNVWVGAGTPGYAYGGYGPAECQGRLGREHCYGGYGDGYYPNRPAYLYDDYEDDGYDAAVSCREARRIIRSRGFRDIVARDCNGSSYSFFASKRGQPYRIKVNAYRGRIVSIQRI